MKQTLLSLLMMLLPLMVHAKAVEIDGIYYNLITNVKTAEVTMNPYNYRGKVVIPSNIVNNDVTYSVTSIGESAFEGCSGLTSITIPNSVTAIGEWAFCQCSGLTSVTLPNSVKSIENYTFFKCSSLTSITIPNSVKSIGYEAFYRCSGLTSVTIPNSVKSIGEYAFRDCSRLASITIPNSVTSIGEGAFQMCCGLNSVTIPNSVTSIGSSVFYGCSGLTSIIIPKSVTSIGDLAFRDCSHLASITIPNSVKSIGYDAFKDCSGLTSIIIPNSVTTIEDFTFSGCSGLLSFTIPNSVKSIGSNAFAYCSGLTSITIPNSVTSIKEHAFSGCSCLTSITIGSGVINIGSSTLGNCPELTDVYCYAENVPSTNANAFNGSYIEHATLHVPASSVNAYKNTEPWSKFKNIVGIGKQYYTLTYMLDGTKYKEYSVGEGDNITAEPAPTKDGYTFSGWSSIPGTMPANDVTVTGTFTKNAPSYYTLTYMVDGQVYKTFNYAAGATVAQVEPPMKDGYTFSGWSNTLLTMPERNVTITGTFTKNVTPTPTPTPTYTLTYMVNGEVYKTVSYEYGEKITPEPEPTKEGATFSGWSWIPSKMPDEDVVVTGTFDMEKYKLTYKVDGADYKILEVEVGAAITPEPEPTKDGYTFSGWSWIPKKMPEEDVTITGTFTPSTGVETAVGSGRPFDVYTVTGRKVRSQVTSLKGLKKGVYIVEGKKVVVK